MAKTVRPTVAQLEERIAELEGILTSAMEMQDFEEDDACSDTCDVNGIKLHIKEEVDAAQKETRDF